MRFIVDFSIESDEKYIQNKTIACPVCGMETEEFEVFKVG